MQEARTRIPKICDYYLDFSPLTPNYAVFEQKKTLVKNTHRKRKFLDLLRQQKEEQDQLAKYSTFIKSELINHSSSSNFDSNNEEKFIKKTKRTTTLSQSFNSLSYLNFSNEKEVIDCEVSIINRPLNNENCDDSELIELNNIQNSILTIMPDIEEPEAIHKLNKNNDNDNETLPTPRRSNNNTKPSRKESAIPNAFDDITQVKKEDILYELIDDSKSSTSKILNLSHLEINLNKAEENRKKKKEEPTAMALNYHNNVNHKKENKPLVSNMIVKRKSNRKILNKKLEETSSTQNNKSNNLNINLAKAPMQNIRQNILNEIIKKEKSQLEKNSSIKQGSFIKAIANVRNAKQSSKKLSKEIANKMLTSDENLKKQMTKSVVQPSSNILNKPLIKNIDKKVHSNKMLINKSNKNLSPSYKNLNMPLSVTNASKENTNDTKSSKNVYNISLNFNFNLKVNVNETTKKISATPTSTSKLPLNFNCSLSSREKAATPTNKKLNFKSNNSNILLATATTTINLGPLNDKIKNDSKVNNKKLVINSSTSASNFTTNNNAINTPTLSSKKLAFTNSLNQNSVTQNKQLKKFTNSEKLSKREKKKSRNFDKKKIDQINMSSSFKINESNIQDNNEIGQTQLPLNLFNFNNKKGSFVLKSPKNKILVPDPTHLLNSQTYSKILKDNKRSFVGNETKKIEDIKMMKKNNSIGNKFNSYNFVAYSNTNKKNKISLIIGTNQNPNSERQKKEKLKPK